MNEQYKCQTKKYEENNGVFVQQVALNPKVSQRKKPFKKRKGL